MFKFNQLIFRLRASLTCNKTVLGNLSLFAWISMKYRKWLGIPAEMELWPVNEVCCRVQGACRKISVSCDVVSLREVNADGLEQMQLNDTVLSRWCCRAAGIQLHSPRVSELLLPSCSFPDIKFVFLGQKFHFCWNPRSFLGFHRNSCKKAGIPQDCLSTREGRSAGEALQWFVWRKRSSGCY